MKRKLPAVVFGIGIPLSLLASNEHGDPYASQFLAIFFLLIGAIVGGYISRKLNQPPVLGELLIGIIVGSILYEAGDHVAISIRHHTEIDHLISNYFEPGIESHSLETELAHSDISSETKGILTKLFNDAKYEQVYLYTHFTLLFSTIGVLLLLFMVGLEIRIKEMLKLGKVSFSLAFLGVLFPFLLGYLISKLLMHASDNVAIFMGATLGATSIGITARVLKDANVLHIKESKLILGAAVVDDILGLVLLAVLSLQNITFR
ncbi:MAG: hypothetical protein CL843_09935 [Crocinitomicaceae bacterium]|nr:hypothetical protein [Crocinitomicaceae bacterium]|tara:strand:+ start:12341 stop:13126 length:786 start_codon:yes stop_codon:yes gene_type:complete